MARLASSICFSLYLSFVTCQSTFPNDVNCVSTFRTDPKLFDEARKKITFVFKFDPPHINRNEKLTNEKSRPFPCRDRERLYPGLRGAFFDILDRVGTLEHEPAALPIRNALCVYAGDNCTYDGTVRFVNSAFLVGAGHKFVTGSYLNYMPNRELMNVVTSSQTFTNKVLLLHRPELDTNSYHGALQRVLAPFKPSGWGIVGAFSTCICLLFTLFFFWFQDAKEKCSIISWLINDVQQFTKWQRVAWVTLKQARLVLLALVFLLYDLALTLSLFKGPPPLLTSLSQFKNLDVSRLGLVKETANEYIAHAWINPENAFNSSSFPWQRFDGFEDALRAFRRREIDYLFTLEGTIKYELHRRNLCNSMSLSELDYPSIVGGWYYSRAIPYSERKRVDEILLRMRVSSETANGLLRHAVAPLDCGAERTFVDDKILLIQLGSIVLPMIILSFALMVVAKLSSNRENRNGPP